MCVFCTHVPVYPFVVLIVSVLIVTELQFMIYINVMNACLYCTEWSVNTASKTAVQILNEFLQLCPIGTVEYNTNECCKYLCWLRK